jgi:hypothetical protein
MPIAIGRSNPEPSFFRSAGARLMVIRVGGRSKPEFLMLLLQLHAGEVDLHIDQVGVDTVHGGAARLEKHLPGESSRPKLIAKVIAEIVALDLRQV